MDLDLDLNQTPTTGRKVKFAPKKPTKPTQAPKTEARDEQQQAEENAEAQALMRLWKEHKAKSALKVERKSSVQVAFGPGGSSLKTYGTRGKSSGSASKYSANEQNGLTRSSAAIDDQSDTCMIDVTDGTTNASSRKIRREYKEPWDYQHSYYPTTLPLREPYSGDPEILDEEEFGEAATSVEYDHSTVNSAAELGLLEKSEQQRMLFFQLPAMPLIKQAVSRKGKDKIGASTVSAEPPKGNALDGLTGGYMGKMLVYKSGAIKLKLGETLFDVSSGSKCIFAQDIVAMNTAQKNCCVLGEVSKRAVVTPDLDSIEL